MLPTRGIEPRLTGGDESTAAAAMVEGKKMARVWGEGVGRAIKEEERASGRLGAAASRLPHANGWALPWRRRPGCPTGVQGAREKGEEGADRWAWPGKETVQLSNLKTTSSLAQKFTRFLLEQDQIIKNMMQQESLEKLLYLGCSKRTKNECFSNSQDFCGSAQRL
jgi:hypothetical protein